MKEVKYPAIIVILFFSMISCESNSYQEVSGTVENPTYEANVKQIIAANCLSCHSHTSDNQVPLLENYDQVTAAILNGTLLEQISAPSGQGMPVVGRMPQGTIDLITRWANNGFIIQ